MVGEKDAAGMSVIVLLIVAGGSVAAGFLGAFVWAVRSGQFDDTCTPAIRILFEDDARPLMPVGLPPEENPGDNEVAMSAESGRFV